MLQRGQTRHEAMQTTAKRQQLYSHSQNESQFFGGTKGKGESYATAMHGSIAHKRIALSCILVGIIMLPMNKRSPVFFCFLVLKL